MLSARFKNSDGTWFEDYVIDNGYLAAKKALTSMTPEEVIDEVTHANLRGLGGAGFPAGHLEPAGRRFARGSTLYFLSEGAESNPYGDEAVYELELGARGQMMPVEGAEPRGAPTEFYWHREEREENRTYQAWQLEGGDGWLWEMVFAPERKSYPFSVNGLASTPSSSVVELWLQGASDFAASPDHHIRVAVNGQFVGEKLWDGMKAVHWTEEILPGLLQEGENELELENVGDTEAAYSAVMLDRFAVSYPRVLVAEGGVVEGSWSASGVAEISGVGSGGFVVDVTSGPPRWLSGVEVTAEGTVRFRAERVPVRRGCQARLRTGSGASQGRR